MLIETTRPQTFTTAGVEKRSVLRAFFSFPMAQAALLIVVAACTVRGRLSDPDLWWHLKTGELIWRTHSIPHFDLFSFTVAGQPWTAQEWLSEVTIYGAYRWAGYSGLMAWLFLLAAAIVLGGYLLCTVYSGSVNAGFLGGMITWVFATVGFAVRPHMLGFLILLCELLVLELGRKRDSRWFYALPPLFALWINVHGSFIIGFVILAAVLASAFLHVEWGLVAARPWPRKTAKTLALAGALAIPALFCNPVGPKLIWYPIDVMFHQPLNLRSITEWQPPDLGSMRGVLLLIITGAIVLAALIRSAKVHIHELLLLAVFFYFAARHERMEFPFGILAAPILCRLLADAWDRYHPESDRIVPNAVLMLIAAAAVALAFPGSRALAGQVNKANPVKAVEFLQQSGLSGRMLNDYGYGGYLIWAAPERPVFIDGRADVYEPAGVLADYMRFVLLDADPEALLSKYRIDYCLFAQEERIARVLPLIPGWKKIYSDEKAVIFAKKH
ncbi:MAG TPA: hypothetical protein VIY49_11655 [Bryobacteraceae bacterium]